MSTTQRARPGVPRSGPLLWLSILWTASQNTGIGGRREITVIPFTLDRAMKLLRVVAGLLLLGHGAQKLFGAFGGPGIRGFSGWLSALGLPAPTTFAWFVGLCEFLGGLLLVIGLLSPLPALAITAVMLGAIVVVHWSKGLWAAHGGIEFPLVLLAIAFVVGLAGPGRYALDDLYHIALPAAQTIYIVGLVLELIAAAVLQVARVRQATMQRTTT